MKKFFKILSVRKVPTNLVTTNSKHQMYDVISSSFSCQTEDKAVMAMLCPTSGQNYSKMTYWIIFQLKKVLREWLRYYSYAPFFNVIKNHTK